MRTRKRIIALIAALCMLMFAAPALAQEEYLTVNGIGKMTLPEGAMDMTGADLTKKIELMSSDAKLSQYYTLWLNGAADENSSMYAMPGKLGLITVSARNLYAEQDLKTLQALWPTICDSLGSFVDELDTSDSCVGSLMLADTEACTFFTTCKTGEIPIELKYYLMSVRGSLLMIETMIPAWEYFAGDMERLAQRDSDNALLESMIYSLAPLDDDSGDIITYPPANISITPAGDDKSLYTDLDRRFSMVVPNEYMYFTPDETYDFLVESDFSDYSDDQRALIEYWLIDGYYYEMTAVYSDTYKGMVGVIESEWMEFSLDELELQVPDIIDSFHSRMYDVTKLDLPNRYMLGDTEYNLFGVSCRLTEGGEKYNFLVFARTEGVRLHEINLWFAQSATSELTTELIDIVESISYETR